MAIDALLRALVKVNPGVITSEGRDGIVRLLVDCWQDFAVSDETSMDSGKLYRLEELQWNPPLLSFMMERHGGTVLGSTRAELHEWQLNLETRTAHCERGRYRQLEPPSPRLDVKPIAAAVLEAIEQGSASNSDLVRQKVIVWRSKHEVCVYHGKLIGGLYQQTVANRRKRFRDELTNVMKPCGWKLVGVGREMIFKREA